MNPEFKVTLDIAQLVMVGGLIWGLAKMSTSVAALKGATDKLTAGLEAFGVALAGLVTRVTVLEDRDGRRRHTDV